MQRRHAHGPGRSDLGVRRHRLVDLCHLVDERTQGRSLKQNLVDLPQEMASGRRVAAR
jgi:hypothetical protein